MKKVIISIITTLIISFAASAQVEDHAIGLRFGGGNFGSGVEFNYLHGMGNSNRIELGLGINSLNGASYTSIVGVYQWVFEIGIGFNWYIGPGAQLLMVEDASAILLGGEIGVEYNFNTVLDIPFQLGLDTRPMFNLGNGNGFGWGGALSARYTF